MRHHDVIILGLGAMGSAAAYHAASRGLQVLGLDRFHPPHDRGSSHGATRVIRQAYFEHPSYVPLLLRSYELWRALERDSGRTLLRLTGGLMMGAERSEVVAGSRRSAGQFGLDHECLDASDLRRRYPAFRVTDDTVALFERSAGFVYCEEAITAHLELAARSGAELRFDERVIEWAASASGEGVVVRTPGSTHRARHLILTPGPWASASLGKVAIPLVVERQVLFWFRPPAGIEAFLPERFPIYIWQRPDGATPYGFPAVDGPDGGVKIAFYRKPVAEPCQPDRVDRTIREDDLRDMRDAVRSILPGLDGPLVRAHTCLYTLTPDHHFVIGRHPAHPQVALAAGFSGHGFKFATVVGEILADLIRTGGTSHDVSLFDPRRFERIAGNDGSPLR